jgi:Ca2+-dependent lipid-binding protein
LSKFNRSLTRPKSNPVVIALNVFQAKELPSGDDDGSGDPVVVAYHYGTLARSTIFKNTLNPIWNERILIPTYIIGNFIPPLIVNVHDYDKKLVGKDEYEFLGSTHMFLNLNNQA